MMTNSSRPPRRDGERRAALAARWRAGELLLFAAARPRDDGRGCELSRCRRGVFLCFLPPRWPRLRFGDALREPGAEGESCGSPLSFGRPEIGAVNAGAGLLAGALRTSERLGVFGGVSTFFAAASLTSSAATAATACSMFAVSLPSSTSCALAAGETAGAGAPPRQQTSLKTCCMNQTSIHVHTCTRRTYNDMRQMRGAARHDTRERRPPVCLRGYGCTQ